MRFKVDNNLRVVAGAKATPVDLETVAEELCGELVGAGMIEDTPDNYGVSLLEATGPIYVADVCKVLCGYLERETITANIWKAFCGLTVLGDGKCPLCGGELEYVESEGHEIKDGDYFTPNTFVVDFEVYRCRECGEITKKMV